VRTYARYTDADGNKKWDVITTDPTNGSNDKVWVVTLWQCLLLNLGESPFYANYGIPAMQSVAQQVFPDFYVARTQEQFAQYFASLIITKRNLPTPTYDVAVLFNDGVKANFAIPMNQYSQRPI
jgi:hypothetical protein